MGKKIKPICNHAQRRHNLWIWEKAKGSCNDLTNLTIQRVGRAGEEEFLQYQMKQPALFHLMVSTIRRLTKQRRKEECL